MLALRAKRGVCSGNCSGNGGVSAKTGAKAIIDCHGRVVRGWVGGGCGCCVCVASASLMTEAQELVARVHQWLEGAPVPLVGQRSCGPIEGRGICVSCWGGRLGGALSSPQGVGESAEASPGPGEKG